MSNIDQHIRMIAQGLKRRLWLDVIHNNYDAIPVKAKKKIKGKKQKVKYKASIAQAQPASALSVCIVYLCAMAGAEALAAFVNPLWGFLVHFAVLSLLVIHSSLNDIQDSRRLFLTLGLVPFIRITSLAISAAEFSDIYWYLIIAIPVLVAIMAVARATGITPKEIGLNIYMWWVQVLIAVTGIGFGALEYLILKPEPMITEMRWPEMTGPVLILLLTTGLVEEMAFRGAVQRAVQGVARWGWIYVAFLYTSLQIWHKSPLHCLAVFGIALFYGWVVKKTGSIVGVSLSHGLINVGLYLVYPFIL